MARPAGATIPPATLRKRFAAAADPNLIVAAAMTKFQEAADKATTEEDAVAALAQLMKIVNKGHAAVAFRSDLRGLPDVPDVPVCCQVRLYNEIGQDEDPLYSHYVVVTGDLSLRRGALNYTAINLGTKALVIVQAVEHTVAKDENVAAAVAKRDADGESKFEGVSTADGRQVKCSRVILLPNQLAAPLYEKMADGG